MRAAPILFVLVLASIAVGAVVVERLPDADASGSAPVDVARPEQIASVAIDGRGLPIVALRSLLTTHAGDIVDAAKLEADRAAMRSELVARGYRAADVAPARVIYGHGGAAYVVFDVRQGPLFRLRSVKVTGAGAHDAGVVTLAAGDIADSDRVERARQEAVDALSLHGNARVDVKLTDDRAAAVVDVELATRSSP